MIIEKDRVVTLDYVLKDDGGEILDRSADDEPLAYLHGRGNIIPGLERELEGKAEGDSLSVTVKAEDAYGAYSEELVAEIPKANFGDAGEISVGMQFEAHEGDSVHLVTVTAVDGDKVTVDGNHPLAGQTLHFQVSVVQVREATAQELTHGHIHQSCGCDSCGDGECGDGECGEAGEGCGCGGCA
jgi:FKBP-type peptidyl-prolyl cis-trans isomerase SlyD